VIVVVGSSTELMCWAYPLGLCTGLMYWIAGAVSDARNAFMSGLQKHPPTARFLRKFADFEKRQQDLARASQLFERAAMVDPQVCSRLLDCCFPVQWSF
jgi:hypothetical protein